MKSRDTIDDVSTRIRSLKAYGVRKVKFEAPGYIIFWSNNSASWGRGYYANKAGDIVDMDANVTLAYVGKDDLERMLPLLPDLPLYGNSFEASRGKGRAPKPDTESRCACPDAINIPDSHFDAHELRCGIEYEMIYTENNAGFAKMIAKRHLAKEPHYYTELIRGLSDNR